MEKGILNSGKLSVLRSRKEDVKGLTHEPEGTDLK
jgi:hypothetical protein